HHEDDAEIAMLRVNVALHPVVGRAATELPLNLRIARNCLIKLGAFEQDFLEAENDRAVRIFRRLAARMVLAMHGDPLAGDDARAHPQPESEDMPECGMQIEAPMGRVPVKIERYAHEGELHHHERDQRIAPKAKIQKSIKKVEVHRKALQRDVEQTD